MKENTGSSGHIEIEVRKNWEHYFKKMKENNEDHLLIDDSIDLDTGQWEWT